MNLPSATTESDTAVSDTAVSDTAESDTAESDTAESDTVETDLPAFDGTVFRRVIGSFMSGVVVITTSHDGRFARCDGQRGFLAVARPADAAGLPARGQRHPGGGPPLGPFRGEHPGRGSGRTRRALRSSSSAPTSSTASSSGPVAPECRCWRAPWPSSNAGSPRRSPAARIEYFSGRSCMRRPPRVATGLLPREVRQVGDRPGRRGLPAFRRMVLSRRPRARHDARGRGPWRTDSGVPVVGVLRVDPAGRRQPDRPRPRTRTCGPSAGRGGLRRRP